VQAKLVTVFVGQNVKFHVLLAKVSAKLKALSSPPANRSPPRHGRARRHVPRVALYRDHLAQAAHTYSVAVDIIGREEQLLGPRPARSSWKNQIPRIVTTRSRLGLRVGRPLVPPDTMHFGSAELFITTKPTWADVTGYGVKIR
jgi:hypothetical protein